MRKLAFIVGFAFVLLYQPQGAYALTCDFGSPINGTQCRGFLTSGTTWTVPADWNSASNTIQAIGGGGNGQAAAAGSGGRGGSGGCYAAVSNFSASAGSNIPYQVGAGGGTTGSGTSPTSNTWFDSATTLVAAGASNTTANCVGSTVYAGGAGAAGFLSDKSDDYKTFGGGGGGGGGPNGAGNSGTQGSLANDGNGGNGGSGDAGFGGSGGLGNPYNSAPTSGGSGIEWSSSPAYGAGGGGGGAAQFHDGSSTSPPNGANGGSYGGGGGGGGYIYAYQLNDSGGAGAQGLIVITYAPVQSPICSITFSPASPIPYNTSDTLSWTSSNATDVYITSVGYVGSSGSTAVVPLASTSYACQAGNGTSTSTTPATLYVGPAAYLSQSASTSTTQSTYTITATSSNATACTTYAELPGGATTTEWTGTSATNSTTTAVTGTTSWWNICSNAMALTSTSTILYHTVQNASCTLNGTTVQSGTSYTFYSVQTAPSGQLCSGYSQSRTCTNGTLSGSNTYQYGSCGCTAFYSCSGEQIQYINSSCATSNYGSACTSPQFCQAGSSSCVYPSISFNSSGSQTGNLQVIPNLVGSGESTKVYWNVSSAQSCTVTGSNGDSWTGLSGTKTSKAITAATTYTLFCEAYGSNPNVTEVESVNVVPRYEEI